MFLKVYKKDIFIFIIIYLFLTTLALFELFYNDDKKKFFKQFEIYISSAPFIDHSHIKSSIIGSNEFANKSIVYKFKKDFNDLLLQHTDQFHQRSDYIFIISFFSNDIDILNKKITNFRNKISNFEYTFSRIANLNRDYLNNFESFVLSYIKNDLSDLAEFNKFVTEERGAIEETELIKRDTIEDNEIIFQKEFDIASKILIDYLNYISLNELIAESKENKLISIRQKEILSDYIYENINPFFLYRYMFFIFLYSITILLFYKILIKNN